MNSQDQTDARRYRRRRDDDYMRLLRELPAGHTSPRDTHHASYDAHSDWLPKALEELSTGSGIGTGSQITPTPNVKEPDAVALRAERDDAARYRWLKANHLQTGTDSWIRTGDDLEEAIDSALAAEQTEGKP